LKTIQDAGAVTVLDVDIKSKRFVSGEGVALEVLRNVAFTCENESFTSIVGPSGCGKTTTLRCILGLDNDYEGRVQVADSQSTQSIVSAAFQEPRLLPWRTVEQNVRLCLQQADKEELDLLFEELGLSSHRAFFPTELSLGLARRVSLARAFAVKPSVLILDEPFVSLDEETASRLRTLLLSVWSARPCIALMVTHNLAEAIELSDRILFFPEGPTGVIDEFVIPVPREQRDLQTVNQIKDDLLARGVNVLSVDDV